MQNTQKRKNGRIARGGAALALVTAAVFGGALLSAPVHAATPSGSPAQAEAQTAPYCPYEVTAGTLNVRDDDSTSGDVVRVVHGGTEVMARPSGTPGWMQLGANEYASSQYLAGTGGSCLTP